MNDIKMTEEQFKAFLTTLKHDPASSPLVVPQHGENGVFAMPAVRPEMYSAHMNRGNHFLDFIPVVGNPYLKEIVQILTGVTDTSGTTPDTNCDTPPVIGNLKTCAQVWQFGKFYLGTPVVNVTQVGDLVDRAQTPRQLQNLIANNNPFVPDILRRANVNLSSETARQFYLMATAFTRLYRRIGVDGNSALTPAQNDALGIRGAIRAWDGLSSIVTDGYVDISGNACPAADSLVIDWSAAVDATVDGLNIVEQIHDLYYSRSDIADGVGMEGVEWAFIMDKRLFRALAFIFACNYANARCASPDAGSPVNRDATAIEARFNEMQRGRYLLIDGVPVPVRFNNGTEATDNGDGTFTDDLYLVPFDFNGRPLLRVEYKPLDNQYALEWNALANTTKRMYHNNGMFITAVKSEAFCDQLVAYNESRLMLDAPFLAGRIDGITFTSYKGYRANDPLDSTYFYNGGVTQYTGYTPE